MSGGFRALPASDLARSLEELLLPRLTEALRSRAPGHCMRVSDLGPDLMVALATGLRSQAPSANVYVLGDDAKLDDDLHISSTKLVELRNPRADGSPRPPLCVFLPANLRTSAEDSFGKATFEEFAVGDVYAALRQQLLKRVPSTLQGYVRDCLQLLEERRWRWAGSAAQVQYLLCAQTNGNDGEAFGGALYELGLVPDFKLFDDPPAAYGRVSRNQESVASLTDGDASVLGRVLDLELTNPGLRRRLAEYLGDIGIEDPVAWTRDIVLDRKNWDLSFDKWTFGSEMAPDRITFVRVETDLPIVPNEGHENERLADLAGQRVLTPAERRKIGVTLEVSPHPGRVRGLDHFTVQIVSQETGPVGASRKVKVWKPARTHAAVSLLKLNRIDFEEGWHHVRVLPWTAEDDPIPMDEPDEPTGRRTNESEPFYVLPDAAIDEEPPQRAVPRAISVEHARLDRQFAAVMQHRAPAEVGPPSIGWTQHGTATRTAAQATIEARFGTDGAFQIPVARWLKNVEQRILETPEQPSSWRMQLHAGQPHMPTRDVETPVESAAMRGFVAARSAYFRHVAQDTGDLVSQGLDVLSSGPAVIAYAAAYVDLLKDLSTRIERQAGAGQLNAIGTLRAMLSVDTVRLVVEDYRGQVREAALIAPVHPLRALWQLAWAQLGAAWVQESAKAPGEHAAPARDALLRELSSDNVPPMLAVSDGRVFTAVDNIHPFWPLYAPATEGDPRGLLGDVCAALGVPEPSIGGAAITGDVLASRIERYLIQHPYVRTLTLNAFNAGRANVLADALAALQRQEAFRDLRYDVRLFVPNPDAPGVGEAIGALLAGGGTPATEAFAIPTASHVFPKLGVAVRATADFLAGPTRHRAHISVLFDLFPPEEVAAGRLLRADATAPIHGLVQDFTVRFQDDESGIGWRRQPRHGTPVAIEGGEEASTLLGELPALISAATATVARSTADFDSRPIVRLELEPAERALISEVHNVSDWVFTIDRNMGIEFFDHGGRRDRPDYLIDYTPSAASANGHRLIISSRSLAELEAMISPVLEEYGLNADVQHAVLILTQLRSLSGRLALKLVSAPTARAEALGLALVRLFLEYQGALRNQIVVPLDAHVDLFHTARNQAEAVGDEVTLRRTDLALFDLDLGTRSVTCNLVEVKCCAQRLGLSGYGQLKEHITQQLDESERILQQHFDPLRTTPDRPDRLLKTRQFTTLLEFYLERSRRYGLMESDAAEEARALLDRLEEGYTLRFSRSGVVFDFDKPGTEPADQEAGIEFHRVGIDLIRGLVNHAVAVAEPPVGGGSSTTTANGGDVDGQGEVLRSSSLAPKPIPRLDRAAFLVEDRARSTTEPATEATTSREAGSGQFSGDAPASSPTDEPTVPALVNRPAATSATPAPRATDRPAASTGTESAAPQEGILPTKERPTASGDTAEHANPNEPEPPDGSGTPIDKAVASAPSTPKAGLREEGPGLECDSVLGVPSKSPQYGLLGESSGRRIALDMNQTHTISLFGVQGGGKSYTLGSIIEMACMRIAGVNELPHPLAGVIFHYSSTLDYRPEFVSMADANADPVEVEALRARYGAAPQAIEDLVILTPADKVDVRRNEYPGITVLPIAFAASELKASHWKFLMGAVGSQSMYIRQLALIMKKLRGDLTLDALRQAIEQSALSDYLKDLALLRLKFAAEYIDDTCRLTDVLRPGRLVVVDLRDELIEKDEALGLFVVLLQMFAETTWEGRRFNKLVVFDEAHKYIGSPDLVAGLVEIVREMRHKGTSILVASQDPPSVPTSLIELSTQIILHKFNSPAWLKHVQKANSALDVLTPNKLAALGPGQGYIWSSRATDDEFTRGAVKIRFRPRVTRHGGGTKTATAAVTP